jgi:hypothetical protein
VIRAVCPTSTVQGSHVTVMVGARLGAGCGAEAGGWADAITAYASDASEKPVEKIRRITCHLVADDFRATVVPPATIEIDHRPRTAQPEQLELVNTVTAVRA